jgi:hypothetical protein
MIELSAILVMMSIFFAMIGFMRGWNKEIVSTAGVVLGLFALFQFDTLLRGTLLANVNRDQVFFVQAGIFIAIVFFAYQTRSIMGADLERAREGRDSLQEGVLGALLGALNGYLIWGSIWYFMDINEYPLSPYVVAPAPGSPSAQTQNILPLVLLGGGPGGNGDLLAIAVIILFVFVLILI